MQQVTKSISRVVLSAGATLLPGAVFAAKIVPDCPQDGPCGYADLITMANNIISFLVIDISVPIATISFVYAGFLYITSGGNEGQVSKAHEIFKKVIIGFIIAASAWLLVHMILTTFNVGTQYKTVVQ